MKLTVELPLKLGSDEEVEAAWCTFTESSSISPWILGRRRAAIFTLWVVIMNGGELTVNNDDDEGEEGLVATKGKWKWENEQNRE